MRKTCLCLILLMFCNACSAEKKQETPDTKASVQAEAKLKEKAENKAAPTAGTQGTVKLAKGTEVKELFSEIKIKDLKGKEDLLVNKLSRKKNNIILLVKKGCVYCNSLLAVLNAEDHGSANLIIVLDQDHSTFKEFQEEAQANKDIKAATWVYDYESAFINKHETHSYPNFYIVDSKYKIINVQPGLVMLADPAAINKDGGITLVLQALAANTAKWMQQW